ncbi:MAG: dockerin type I repeat-containing protein [Candidatus Zixiibacteriota bacterium]|nr:MAG: dockerin type I repeat-containing protein [candidate division Zixibacteria bacterium]
MKKVLLMFVGLAWVALLFSGQVWAECYDDPNDNGIRDTLHIEIYPEDQQIWPPPEFVRFSFLVTHDIVDPYVDSIAGFVLPFCFTSSNPAAHCTLDPANNTTDLYPRPDLNQSIFRHLPSMEDPQVRNWMMDLSAQGTGLDWDTRILDMSQGNNMWFHLIATGTEDQRFPDGNRILLATFTFSLQDSTTICIDSCFLPCACRYAFSRSDAVTYLPCHYPTCEVIAGGPETWIECPPPEARSANGTYQSGSFVAGCDGGVVTGVELYGDPPPGISDVQAFFTSPLGQPYVLGYLTYTVSDHCLAGADIRLCVFNDFHNGPAGDCYFQVAFGNNPPAINLPDTWRALSGYTMTLHVPASDVDGDAVDVATLDGFWYEPDSLQPPINSPSFDGGNPALLTWVPDQSETGNWICSFTAADACGAEDTRQLTIQVGAPFCGDCTGEGDINLGDVVCLISYLYRQGPPPDPLCMGDANGDGSRDVGDVVLLINYLFRSSFAPCFDCCP